MSSGADLTVESFDRLGEAVRQRRRRVGLTQDDVARRGGPSGRTIRSIENGSTSGLGRGTLANLDDGLFWDRGTSEALLKGEITVSAAVEARQVAVVGAPRRDAEEARVPASAPDTTDLEHVQEEALNILARHGLIPRLRPTHVQSPQATPQRAAAPLARALAELQALEDQTDVEKRAVDVVWQALQDVMSVERASSDAPTRGSAADSVGA